MDGVDLFIEGGRRDHYPEFIRELRKLMDKDTQKHYLITSAPECLYPDAFLGPKTKGSGGDRDFALALHLSLLIAVHHLYLFVYSFIHGLLYIHY